jgi:hypothetical protein
MRLMTQQERENIYPSLFQKVFKYYNEDQRPTFIVVHEEDGQLIGFASCLVFNKKTVYIQYAGLVPEYRNKGHWQMLDEMMEWINSALGATLFTAKVGQRETLPLRIALKQGWLVYSTEPDGKGGLLINISKYIGD